MVKETFGENRLEWKFTEDVVNRISELKNSLVDYLPNGFRELGRMSRDELEKRQKCVLLSLVEALSISPNDVGVEEDITMPTTDMPEEQKEYL